MSIGDLWESLTRAMLAGVMLVGRLGVVSSDPRRRRAPLPPEQGGQGGQGGAAAQQAPRHVHWAVTFIPMPMPDIVCINK